MESDFAVSDHLSIYLSTYIYLSIYVSIYRYLSIYLSIYLYLYTYLSGTVHGLKDVVSYGVGARAQLLSHPSSKTKQKQTALPAEAKIESGTSQSKSGICVDSFGGGERGTPSIASKMSSAMESDFLLSSAITAFIVLVT